MSDAIILDFEAARARRSLRTRSGEQTALDSEQIDAEIDRRHEIVLRLTERLEGMPSSVRRIIELGYGDFGELHGPAVRSFELWGAKSERERARRIRMDIETLKREARAFTEARRSGASRKSLGQRRRYLENAKHSLVSALFWSGQGRVKWSRILAQRMDYVAANAYLFETDDVREELDKIDALRNRPRRRGTA